MHSPSAPDTPAVQPQRMAAQPEVEGAEAQPSRAPKGVAPRPQACS